MAHCGPNTISYGPPEYESYLWGAMFQRSVIYQEEYDLCTHLSYLRHYVWSAHTCI